jgi:hypothetical protein
VTLTGPQKIPFASTAYWYGDDYSGSAMESNVVVVHTTEGTTLPSYDGGSVAPNITGLPDFAAKKIRWYQHFDVDRSSRALVNSSGGVETNTANAFQIELVGSCDPNRRTSWGSQRAGEDYFFWPDAPDWALAEVGKLLRWLHDNHGVALRSTVTWKAYPASYGSGNGVRLTGAQWNDYYGVLGHQHVPENFHGDPGDIDMAKILAYALGTNQEEDMALTDDDIKKVGRQVVTGANGMTGPDDDTVWALSSYVQGTYRYVRSISAKVDALTAKVDSISVGGVDIDALAAKVADVLHDRLSG